MRIAFVGWTSPEDDTSILLDCYQILQSLKPTSYDFIDLNRGRDFLKESKRYDIVVLIYIFIGIDKDEIENEPMYFFNDPLTKVSDLHSQENWRQRLLDTEAREILIFGYNPYSEISGDYIGELDSYEKSIIELKSAKCIYGRVWRYSKTGDIYLKDTNYDSNYRNQAHKLR